MNEGSIVRPDCEIEETRFKFVITTQHEGVEATTAIHTQDFERRIGGARFVDKGNLTEVARLSSTMTAKCLAAMIPADGQKSLIVTGGKPLSEERRAQILIEHVRVLKTVDPGVIIGPDMKNAEPIQDLAALADGLLDHFTGLSRANRGLEIDANGYTAHGVVAAIRACMDDVSLRGKRVTIQGFGAVGAHAARLLGEAGAIVVGVNNKDVLFTDGDGLDIPSLFDFAHRYGDENLKNYQNSSGSFEVSSRPDDIFEVPTDIFIPAGRTGVLATADELEHARVENRDVRDVADFYAATGVSLIAEGANCPLSRGAEHWLESKGVRILPDFIANCGGLIGCWVEWEARHKYGLKPAIDLEAVGHQALVRIRRTVTENVRELLRSELTAREAAEEIGRRNRARLLASRRN